MKPFEGMINEVWDDSIVPTLCRYIEIPNKSPMFDADWHAHGYMRDAVKLLEDWCRRSPAKGWRSNRRALRRTPVPFGEITERRRMRRPSCCMATTTSGRFTVGDGLGP
jgi:hypothetical protein